MLSEHHHSGRVLPHHHTSFAGLSFLLILTMMVLLACSTPGKADQSSLSLRVDGPAPTQAATILQPVTGQSFTYIPVAVSGQCPADLLVKLYRNGQFSGIAVCQSDSTFALHTDLSQGRNELMVRVYDWLDQAGPDSRTVTVNYALAPTRSITKGTKAVPVAAISAPLLITTETTYYPGISPGDKLTWPLEISGGKAPYAVNWNWGDGTSNLYSYAGSGGLKATHVYQKPGNYNVSVKVSDADSRTAYLQLVAIVNGKVAPASTSHYFDGYLLVAWPLWLMTLVMLVSFWLGEKYKQFHPSPVKA